MSAAKEELGTTLSFLSSSSSSLASEPTPLIKEAGPLKNIIFLKREIK
jgi:hypothetical protein